MQSRGGAARIRPRSLLFTLYIRNLRCCLPQQVANQEFADDIAIEASGSCQQVCSSLSTDITGLSQWLEDRGLMLNQRKTQALVITPRGPAPATDDIRICCGNAALAVVEQARYLGVMVDGQLSWEPRVNHTIQQVRKSVGVVLQSFIRCPECRLRRIMLVKSWNYASLDSRVMLAKSSYYTLARGDTIIFTLLYLWSLKVRKIVRFLYLQVAISATKCHTSI